MRSEYIIELIYLVATALFILALKWMSSPTTARRGVRAGELGMLLAICGTLFHQGIVEYRWIAIALVLGSIIGVPLGMVQMTAVPQRTRATPSARSVSRSLARRNTTASTQSTSVHDGGAGAGGHSRFAHVHR